MTSGLKVVSEITQISHTAIYYGSDDVVILLDIPRNSYANDLTAIQMLAYILRSIYEGKSEEQIAERFDGNSKLVKICIDALSHIHFLTRNSFNELVVTPDGEEYLEKFDSHR
jgi:hypothetical protein